MVNTSFNVRGEPIVCSPEDAFKCFMGNELELLVIGNCILRKNVQYYLIDEYNSEDPYTFLDMSTPPAGAILSSLDATLTPSP